VRHRSCAHNQRIGQISKLGAGIGGASRRDPAVAVRGADARDLHRADSSAPRFAERNVMSSSAETLSLRLDVGGPDYLAPFLGFLGDKLAKVGG